MKRLVTILLLLAAGLQSLGAGNTWLPVNRGRLANHTAGAVAARTIYFGNCEPDGSPPTLAGVTFYGAIAFYGTEAASPSTVQKAMEFTCPGSGPQTLNSMEFLGYQRSPGGYIRMAIYTYESAAADGGTIYNYSLQKVAEHTAAVAVNAGTSGALQWFGVAAGLTGTLTLTGGQRYIVASAMDSANVGYGYTTSTNAISQLSGNHTGGLPDPLTGGSINNSSAHVVRLSVTGNGTAAPAPTQETYYVDTDYAGGGSDGSPTKPYTNLQTAIAARCNKTFTRPVWIYCSGEADDTIAVNDSALGQFVASETNQLYIVGDRTAATWDATKYKLIPADRTAYYGAINNTKSYMNFDRMQVYLPSTTASFSNEICYQSAPVTGVFKNSIIRAPGGSDATRYFSSIYGIKLYNNLMYGMGTAADGNGIKNHGTSYLYSCTILAGSADGVDNTDGATITLKNCYIQSSHSSGTIVGTGSSTEIVVTTATSDSDGTSGLQNIALSTANFTNATAGSEDLRLPTGSALIGVGTDTSGDAAPFNFTTDITGATRTGTWDVGAAKY